MNKPTLFVVTDIETTLKYRMAFDVSWQVIDRHGKVYDKASYLIKETFALDIPYFRSKMGEYFQDTYDHKIEPVSMLFIRDRFNDSMETLRNQGHNVIFAAYNAAFDARYLGETCYKLTEKQFLGVPMWMLCIWQFWCESAPKTYNYATPKGNPKTSAEYVYRFEMNDPDFVEKHIAHHDVSIEKEILLKVLDRKKKMPLTKSISGLGGSTWRLLKDYPAYLSGDVIIAEEQHP